MEPKEVANLHPSIVVEYLPGACYDLLLNYKPRRSSFDRQELYLWIVVEILAGASSLCRPWSRNIDLCVDCSGIHSVANYDLSPHLQAQSSSKQYIVMGMVLRYHSRALNEWQFSQ
jgi:hypothetical protein